MTEKNALLKILHEALNAEEKAAPIYLKHLCTAVQWLGLDKRKVKNIQEEFMRLGRQTTAHRASVEKLIKRIEGDPKGDF